MNNFHETQNFYAKGSFIKRLLVLIFLFPAWFAPHKKLRVFFHRLRGIKIGNNVEIGYFCIIGNVHPSLITIEDNVVITARTTILDHDNALYYTCRGSVNIGPVLIKKNAFIGIGCTIMPNVVIGERSIIAPHSFVNKNVDNNTLVGGTPAKLIKKYNN